MPHSKSNRGFEPDTPYLIKDAPVAKSTFWSIESREDYCNIDADYYENDQFSVACGNCAAPILLCAGSATAGQSSQEQFNLRNP